MFARSHEELHNIRISVERIRGLSDRMVGVGPFGIGMDGILSMIPIPVVGAIYSGLAAGALMLQAVRAHASLGVLMHMAVILGIDTLLDLPAGTPIGPISGAADILFTGHKWAANTLLKHMDQTIYIEGTRKEAMGRAGHGDLMDQVRSGREKRRIVYLG
jgi:hypothetical protein